MAIDSALNGQALSTSTTSAALQYQPGFGNHFVTEALPGVLPEGQNSPQKVAHGLYAEGLSGTAFTVSRAESRGTWVYRIRPSAAHNRPFKQLDRKMLRTAPIDEVEVPPTQLRWGPFPIPQAPQDFVDSLITIGCNGDAAMQAGIGVHIYLANRPMKEKAFYNADGEMLIVPQLGALDLVTELGILHIAPGEIAVIPRGIRFRVELPDGQARGYICENYGAMFRLPELGPIGSNGLANPRDFLAPVAAFEDKDGPYEIVAKFGGRLWALETPFSPFDVVGWHGNLTPYKYDLAKFMVVGSISFDHPDPSINTVLSSPSDSAGIANVDFAIFGPRWVVMEHTFRPPWFHRNAMMEFMGLVQGQYDARAEGFLPGGASLHNCWSAHGPDAESHKRATAAELKPHKLEDTMAFMFESRYILRPTRYAMQAGELQHDYYQCWQGLEGRFGRR